MSARQFQEWFEFDRVDPIGGRRGDWHAASICAAIFNSMAIRANSRTRFRVRDFLLEFGDAKQVKEVDNKPPQQTWQQQKMIARTFAAMFNAGEKQKRKRRG